MASSENNKKRIGGCAADCAADVVPTSKKSKLGDLTSPVANSDGLPSEAQAGFKEKIATAQSFLTTVLGGKTKSVPRSVPKSAQKRNAPVKTNAKNKCKKTSRHRVTTATKKALNEWTSDQEKIRNRKKKKYEADLKL